MTAQKRRPGKQQKQIRKQNCLIRDKQKPNSWNDQKELVREGFGVWADVGIGISFEEAASITETEIRIGFLRDDGAWSYVGRDVIDIPGQLERTMNFGWDPTRESRGVEPQEHKA